jgi:hypothetical protein
MRSWIYEYNSTFWLSLATLLVGVFGFYVRNNIGTTRNTITNTYDDLTFRTTNYPNLISDTTPSYTDSSTKIPTTSWVQNAFQTQYIYNYPQQWYSSASGNSSNTPTLLSQSVDVVFNIPSTASGTDINGIMVDLCIRYYIMGYAGASGTVFCQVFNARFDGTIAVNIKDYTSG